MALYSIVSSFSREGEGRITMATMFRGNDGAVVRALAGQFPSP